MNTDTTSSGNLDTTSRYLGRVKWFNNKAGYGFITVTDGDKSGSDIFAHHSSIGVSNQQYKYLVQSQYFLKPLRQRQQQYYRQALDAFFLFLLNFSIMFVS